jgi:hypothetical protein
MFKKTIGSLIVASALTISLGAVNSEASQSSSAVVEQNQNHYGWSKLLQKQGISSNNTQIEFDGSTSTTSGQSLFVNGYQIQSGKSDGQASASQSDDRTIVVVDEQTTELGDSTEQNTNTSDPSHLLQAQGKTNSFFHFQASIEGGPSLQNQITQRHSFQFSSAISR